PETSAVQFGIALDGVQGFSTARSDIGGMFMTAAVLSFLGLRGGKFAAGYLNAVAIMMALVASGRVIGFALDGVVQMSVVQFVFEIIFMVVMVTAARSVSASDLQ
ncbi:MAG: hypothetical protein DRQ52_11130, partial [Gammaproteobacteria bacterium]